MTTSSSDIYSAIENALIVRGAAPTIVTDTAVISASALISAAEKWAALLHDLDVVAGDRLLVQARNSPELIFLYLAALRSGIVYVPVNTAYTCAEVAYFLNDATPKLFICEPGRCEEYRTLVANTECRLETLGHDQTGTLVTLVGNVGLAPERPALDSRDLAAILYTSGTTGRSKGAMLSQANLLENAQALRTAWQISPDDILLHALPIYHIHGLFVALNTVLLAGAALRFLPMFDSAAVIANLPSVTLFMGVPTYYTRLLNAPEFDRTVAGNVRAFISGSAPLSAETFEKFEKRTGHRIIERYGMTECGIICSNLLDGERIPGAVGKPLEGVKVRIRAGADGEKFVQPGVLEVTGSNVFQGYWKMPELTDSEFTPDGWFITGDLATIDEQGIVRIVGREKDLIISGGLNVYPKEIEGLIEQFPDVEEAAVIGLPHSDFGEAVVAVIATGGSQIQSEEAALVDFVQTMLAGFKRPKVYFYVDHLPRNAMGKVQKSALRQQYRNYFDART